MNRFIQALVAALLALPAAAQTDAQAVPTGKLVEAYAPLAGSEQNATSLVEGLRTGQRVTLTSTTSSGTTTTRFTPPTRPMGNGNVNLALALAGASLEEQGITQPTADQLRSALVGGTVKTASGEVKLEGVLTMRADGMGWGQIANAMGFRLGDVVSAGKREARPERVARTERPDRVEKFERPGKPERPARPDKPERPGR